MFTTTPPSIAAQIIGHASKQSSAIAVRGDTIELTYGDLISVAQHYANWLDQHAKKRACVAVSIKDPVLFLCVFLGARFGEHHVLVMNPEWPANVQSSTLERLKPNFFIDQAIAEAQWPTAQYALQDPTQTTCVDLRLGKPDLSCAFYTGFTSGSEGPPKGFSRHEASWLRSFEIDASYYQLGSMDTVVCPGKLAHSWFLYASLRGLTAGAKIKFIDKLHRPSQQQKLADLSSAVIFAVPAQLQQLDSSCLELHKLRLIVSAGAKLPVHLKDSLARKLPNTPIMECYGSSELSYIALSHPQQNPPKNSVGKPCPGVEIRIVDVDKKDTPAHLEGRILVRSPLKFMGYAEPNNTTSLRDLYNNEGFIDSGDTGYMDAKGFLYITGRSDRMMLIAGHNVFPEQIESALNQSPDVEHVAVFPVDDPLRGQRPIAVICPKSETLPTRASLISYLKKILPNPAVPRQFFYTHTWPTTVSDKSDVKKLISMVHQKQLEHLK